MHIIIEIIRTICLITMIVAGFIVFLGLFDVGGANDDYIVGENLLY